MEVDDKLEKFIIRSVCFILTLIVLLIDHNQYKKIKKSEDSITKIQETMYLDWKLERIEKKLKAPRKPLNLPITDPHEQYAQQWWKILFGEDKRIFKSEMGIDDE